MRLDKGEIEMKRIEPCSAVWDDGEEPVSITFLIKNIFQGPAAVDRYVTETCKTNYKEPMVFTDTLKVANEGSEKSGGSMNSSMTNMGRKLGRTYSN